jgi:Prion-inhibition and propagation
LPYYRPRSFFHAKVESSPKPSHRRLSLSLSLLLAHSEYVRETMTEVASLVVGVVAAWKSCVQVFDIVDSGRRYGMDYEILRIKLEVERIRLLT